MVGEQATDEVTVPDDPGFAAGAARRAGSEERASSDAGRWRAKCSTAVPCWSWPELERLDVPTGCCH